MNHLSDEQLSGLLDDALAPAARAAAESHLAACEVCRAKLAALSALDAELKPALTHDPGEAYFATFAERVGARIATGEGTGVRSGARPASRWSWLLSPRGLSFAGGTAALLVTAGLAWLEFGNPERAGIALRDAARRGVVAPQATETAPAPAADRASAPAADSAPLRNERATNRAAPAPAATRGLAADRLQSQRADEVSSLDRKAAAARPAAPEPNVAGATGAPDATSKDLTARDEGAPATSPQALATPPAARAQENAVAPGFAKLSAANEPHLRGGRAGGLKLQSSIGESLAVRCGTVSDTRGNTMKGVEIMLLGASTRSARTGPDGSFCLPSAVAGDTLILMHVGFEPVRIVLTSTTSLAFGLEPVGTLGSRSGLYVGGGPRGALGRKPFDAGPRPPALTADLPAPAPDVYATSADSVRSAVAGARASVESARRDRSGAAWEHASARWDGVAAMTSGRAAVDARFQSVSALHEAWQAEPTPARAARLRAAVAAFVAGTPATLPERATVLRWQGGSEMRGYR